MSSIDNRIVNMQFNNRDFERNAKTTLGTLDKLKAALNFKGAVEGLSDIARTARGVTFSSLNTAVGTVSGNFSVMEQIAIGALRRIGDQAVSTGERLIRSLTVDQISEGFQKYETEVTSVQTIMNATGKSIDEVQEQLDKLMWFTDETSYSFSDMTSNIGKFTSAGVDLGEATEAMMGISNWAALAGQGTGEASRAMYNLSQAMSVGAVKLMDWKSIENANMATTEFKQSVLDSAVALGTLTKEGNGVYRTLKGTEVTATKFNDTLSEGWFTSEVLLKVLRRYNEYTEEVYRITQEKGIGAAEAMEIIGDGFTGYGEKAFRAAQEAKTFTDAINATKDAVSTGWLKTFELIFGNYEKAKVLWTDLANALYDIFAEPGNYRNEQFEKWASEMHGRERLLRGLYSIVESFTAYLNAFSTSFTNIFGQWDAKTISKVTTQINVLANAFEATEPKLFAFNVFLSKIFSTLKLVLVTVKNVGKTVSKAFSNVFRETVDIPEVINSIASSLVNVASRVKNVLTDNEDLYRILRGIFSFAHILKDAFIELLSFVVPNAKTLAGSIAPKIVSFLADIADKITLFDKKRGIFKIAAELRALPKPLEVLKKAFDSVKNAVSAFRAAFEKATNIRVSDIVFDIVEKFKYLKNEFLALVTLFKSGDKVDIKAALSGVWDFIEEALSVVAPALTKAAGALGTAFGGIFEGIRKVLTNGDFTEITAAIEGLSITGLIAAISKFVNSLTGGAEDLGEGANKIVSNINGVLKSAKDALNTFTTKTKVDSLKKVATAIAILAGSLLVLSLINSEKLEDSILAVTTLFAELLGSLSILGKIDTVGDTTKITALVSIMIGLSAAIFTLSTALLLLSTIKPEALANSVLAITALIAGLVGSMVILSKNTDAGGTSFVKIGLTMAIMAKAIKTLASVVAYLGELDSDSLLQGMIGVISIMGTLIAFILSTNNSKLAVSTGASIFIIALSLKVLASVLGQIAQMDPNSLAISLSAVAGSMFAMGIALNSLPKDAGAKSAGMLVLAAAMSIMAGAISKLAALDPASLAISVLILGTMLAGMVIALNSMKQAISGAFALLVASAALTTFAIALKQLSTIPWQGLITGFLSVVAAIAILVGSAVLLAGLSYALEPFIPMMLSLAAVIGVFSLSVFLLASSAMMFATAMGIFAATGLSAAVALGSILRVIVNAIPMLAKAIVSALPDIFKGLAAALPALASFLASVASVVVVFLDEFIPEMIPRFLHILDSILAALEEYLPSIIEHVVNLIVIFFDGLSAGLPRILEAALNFVITLIESIGTLLEENGPRLGEAFVKLIKNLFVGVTQFLIPIGKFALQLITKLAGAIWEQKDKVWDKLSSMIVKAILKLKELKDRFFEAGANVVDGIIEGIKSMFNKPREVLEEIGANLPEGFKHILGISSPSKVMYGIAKWIPKGIADGIADNAKLATRAVDKMGSEVITSFAEYSALAASTAADEYFSQPTIRPVVDMSMVSGAAGTVRGFFAGQSVQLAGINGRLDMQAADLRAQMDQNKIYNDANVVASISGLRDDVNALNGAMSNMQVVMDTGAVVGATAAKMDQALYQRAVFKGRGN